MFSGAQEYLELRDQLRTLYHQRGLVDAEQFLKAREPLTTKYAKVNKDYESLLAS